MLAIGFAIYDTKSESFGQPFFTHNRASAMRGIRLQLQQDSNSMIAKFPSDFALFEIGSFDEEHGLLEGNKAFVINVSELMEDNNVQQS